MLYLGFMTIVEVCGFNDWLLKLVREYGCRETVLVQPETISLKKTDRRDAGKLSQLLWVNRERLLAGKKVNGLRRVVPPSAADAQDRQITAVRKRLGELRTRTLNQVQRLLMKHNLQQECPVKHRQPYRIGGMMHLAATPEACPSPSVQASPATTDAKSASERQVLEGMAGQENGSGENQQKRLRPPKRPKPDGSFPRPDSVIPCRVAPQQSSTPFHRASTKISP